jgi:hypothetical protein
MSTAGVYNFTLDQGSVFSINLIYNDSSGNPIDLTGQTARMQIRRTFSSAAVLTLTSPSDGIVITPLTGNILVTATTAQTSDLESGFFVYDLELNNQGVVDRIIQGTITVSPQVTQDA